MSWLFRKLSTAISAKLNAILNASVTPEDKMELADEKFREQIQYMQAALVEVKTGRGIAANKRDKISEDIKRMEEDAKLAISKNKEDLARELLARKMPLEGNLTSIDKTIENLDGRIKELGKNLDNLIVQYDQFKAQKTEMVGRFKAAKAEKAAYALVTGIGTRMDGVKTDMARAMDDVNELEAKASALRDMSGFGKTFDSGYKDSLSQEMDKLRNSSDVDNELERLKEQVEKKSKK